MSQDLETMIMGLIEAKVLSAGTIAYALGIPIDKIIHKLRQMENWGIIKLVTRKPVMYWGVPGESCDAGVFLRSRGKRRACPEARRESNTPSCVPGN